jgi:hypothetical protein
MATVIVDSSSAKRGRHVVDLTDEAARARVADYQAAFGLPSPLHHQPLPVVVAKGSWKRLRDLVHRS